MWRVALFALSAAASACCDDDDDSSVEYPQFIACVRDADADGFPECGTCRAFPARACPETWLDPCHPTTAPSDFTGPGRACTADEVIQTTRCTAHAPGLCDCCDDDALAYPHSPWALTTANLCGDPVYDCTTPPTTYACCHDAPETRDARPVWRARDCTIIANEHMPCGGCSADAYTPGWACVSQCGNGTTSAPHCPRECSGQCQCSDKVTAPALGQCGVFVDDCSVVQHVRAGDVRRCCVRTTT